RFGTYERQTREQSNQGKLPEVTDEQHADPVFVPLPNYWVPQSEVLAKLEGRWSRPWLIGWRRISGTEKIRTVIPTLFPQAGAGDNIFLLLADTTASASACLVASLSSFILDYIARQQLGGTNLN